MKLKKVKLLILQNEDPLDHISWVKACNDFKEEVECFVVDITKNNWLEEINSRKVDFLVVKPSGKTSIFRQLYQERVEILVNELNLKIFPSLDEIRIYENKKYLAYWLEANNLPHPKTDIFYHKKEAIQFVLNTKLPVVGKMNIGASGNGVQILKTKNEAISYIEKAFTTGIGSRTGPKFSQGKLFQRFWRKLTHPSELKSKLKTYKSVAADLQKGYVILQEYIPHDFEWRVVRIGNSFFAHKKLRVNEKASGTLLKGYENPPFRLLDFVKSLTDKYNFNSQAVDIFEILDGTYLLNEIQCIFGQSDPYQMLVDGQPGRYVYINGKWVFEKGDFNQNQSYNLRIQYLIDTVRIAKKNVVSS